MDFGVEPGEEAKRLITVKRDPGLDGPFFYVLTAP